MPSSLSFHASVSAWLLALAPTAKVGADRTKAAETSRISGNATLPGEAWASRRLEGIPLLSEKRIKNCLQYNVRAKLTDGFALRLSHATIVLVSSVRLRMGSPML